MSDIRVRLLGGFEVWSGDRQVGASLSPNAKAFLAYLLGQRRKGFKPEALVRQLWPDAEPDTAFEALDQAISAWLPLLPSSFFRPTEIGINPRAACWIDVEAFEEGISRGTEREALDLRHLSDAAQLYRGELLDGLSAEGCPGFEAWRAAEQARLRDAALEVFHRLVESCGRRGEHRLGLHYARRRVAIDPSSEEAHRDLMRLFALSGQRNRALAQYDTLLQGLHGRGRAPEPETRALYESVLAEALKREAATWDEAVGPLVPLVGREHADALLRDGWLHALEGKVHLTLVTGESGIGKTRLVESFLDGVTLRRRTIVLQGRCEEMAPLLAYQPLLAALRAAFEDEEERAERVVAALPQEVVTDLARFLPGLVPEAEPGTAELPAPSEASRRLFVAVGRFLKALGEGDPLVLLLDDLHGADRDTLDLLGFLAAHLDRGPIWIVAVCRSTGLDGDHPLEQMVRRGEKDGRATRLELDRLDHGALEEIARSLVSEAQTAGLTGFLAERSGGLPIAVTELINVLWDQGLLAPGEAERWNLTGPLADLDASGEDLEALVRLRVRRLPNSTRRLASLAAILGQSFDLELFEEAADEHIAVLEIGLEILESRGLVRADRGSFTFAHEAIQRALYHELNPLRRQAIHGQVADALTALRGDSDCETLAWHLTSAGQWERALAPLQKSMERAQAMQAVHTARDYHEQWVEALTRLIASARNGAVAERWRGERERVEGLLEG